MIKEDLRFTLVGMSVDEFNEFINNIDVGR